MILIPGFEYFCVECESLNTFPEMINYLNQNKIDLVGTVHDYTNSNTGKNYMFFPIRKF